MSHVRRCDKCGTIFSELESGWQTFTATTIEEDANGNQQEIRQAMDACPSCALKPKRTFERETQAAIEGRMQDARIAELERKVGMDEETGTFTNDEAVSKA